MGRMSTDTSKSLFDQAMKEILATNYVAAELLLQQASEINEEHTTLTDDMAIMNPASKGGSRIMRAG